ncbi:MAG: transcription elongation factor GreA [Clostridia bacterium]|nr:transcription elongation factor GreA [Clostridia bacterium]
MPETKNYTPAEFAELQKELELYKVKREENKKDISTARSFGDLSENSEYDEAKLEQGKIAARIAQLEDMIANAHVLDESELDADTVNVGSTVEVLRVETGKTVTYQLVGSFGADPLNGKISDESPIGAALKGTRVGAVVEVVAPNGNTFHLEVKSITR